MSKIFLDTNVLIYAVDARDPTKQSRAIAAVESCIRDGTGAISTQVLQEFAAVALGKLGQTTDAVLAELSLLEMLEVVQVTPALIRRGVELHARHGVSYWDGAILAAAEAARCDRLWSEDFASGTRHGAIRVENPLIAAAPK